MATRTVFERGKLWLGLAVVIGWLLTIYMSSEGMKPSPLLEVNVRALPFVGAR